MKRIWFIVSVCMIGVGCWYSLKLAIEYRTGRELYAAIEKNYTAQLGDSEKMGERMNRKSEKEENKPDETATEVELLHTDITGDLLPESAPKQLDIDWEKLRQVNKELIAWIQIPAIDVSYPVVQGTDNSFYLHRSFEKEELFSGCLFMDAYNDPDLKTFIQSSMDTTCVMVVCLPD